MSEFKWFSAHRSNQVHFQSSKKSNKLAFKNDILEAAKKYFPVYVNENRFVCLSFYPNFIYLHFTCSIINYFVPFFTKTNMVILPPVSHLPDNNSYFDGQIPYTEMLYLLSSINLIQLMAQQIFTSTVIFKSRFILMGNHPPLLW